MAKPASHVQIEILQHSNHLLPFTPDLTLELRKVFNQFEQLKIATRYHHEHLFTIFHHQISDETNGGLQNSINHSL